MTTEFKSSEEYKKYINSAQWKRLRNHVIKLAGGKCQVCGISKWTIPLEVHHKTYDRFKHERPEDLLVVCPDCHKKVDDKRKIEVQRKNNESLYEARLDGWATKVYGENWSDYHDYEEVADAFDQMLEDHEDYWE